MHIYIKSVQSFCRHIHSLFSSSLFFGNLCVHATVVGYVCMLLCLYFLCKFLMKHCEALSPAKMQFAHSATIHTLLCVSLVCACFGCLTHVASLLVARQSFHSVSVAVRHSLQLGTVSVEQHEGETLFPQGDFS